MAKEETKEPGIGLVTLNGAVGIGIKMPDKEVIELKTDDIGTAQVLAYLVKTVSEIKDNIS